MKPLCEDCGTEHQPQDHLYSPSFGDSQFEIAKGSVGILRFAFPHLTADQRRDLFLAITEGYCPLCGEAGAWAPHACSNERCKG